jgi:hypothetical protein
MKCQAMENTYSKNSSVIPGKFNDEYKLDKGPYKLYKVGILYRQVEFKKIGLDVKPIIHQSELRTYTKVVPLKKIVPFAHLLQK